MGATHVPHSTDLERGTWRVDGVIGNTYQRGTGGVHARDQGSQQFGGCRHPQGRVPRVPDVRFDENACARTNEAADCPELGKGGLQPPRRAEPASNGQTGPLAEGRRTGERDGACKHGTPA